MAQFVHLHVHTQYSILDGASKIINLVKKTAEYKMPALAITDHGNLFGAKDFLTVLSKHNDNEKKLKEVAEQKGENYEPRLIKPIIGCEMYVARRDHTLKDKDVKDDRSGNHLIVLAKNEKGYRNLIKLSSLAYIEGFYSKPRIDKKLLFEHKEGLIISTACIAGEIPRAVRSGNLELAETLINEYKAEFGDDFYLEIQRHKTNDENAAQKVYEQQKIVNEHFIPLSVKCGVKLIATNDVHFINEEDAEAHDRLICINTGSQIDDPNRMHYTKQEWFKSSEEMAEIFADVPEAIVNTVELAEKVEFFNINKTPVMPKFPIPEEFGTLETYKEKYSEEELKKEFTEKDYKRINNYLDALRIKLESDYLQHLVEIGAKKNYGKKLSEEVKQRIIFELYTIKNMGFPGYFLIVQDFISQARKMGIWVGPGRGSAAGSVVSYCLHVTDIDPFKYNLLFERFLNPERISMPDIDIDFDEDGRELILKWVVEKYGKDKVANIITFGTMASKSSIKDVARVQKLPLNEAERLTKLIPEKVDNLEDAFIKSAELRHEKENGSQDVKSTLEYARVLEGSVRQTGIHACGIIICRDSLTEHIPVCTSKETELLVTQFDGHYLEEVGMLKMDFLGLKTLSILKDAIANIELSKGKKIDINKIPLDDKKTYELFSKGLTTSVFQFESENMQKYLRELKPNRFEDLIAMNALYRPGPMKYIPSFINRKQGKEKIIYDLPVMENVLKETYGVTVYQEQVMLLSQKLAGFTKGDADKLRKAMGKKQRAILDKMKGKFIEGCRKNGYPDIATEKIWTDWEEFAEYAFNKSHSTCYAYLAYQTAYLKAHYPAEFLAANLSRNLDDIKEITKLMGVCRRMNFKVLGPDVNESNIKFNVNKDGNLRFGLGAIKGLGEAAADIIIKERNQNGNFKDIYDFVERINISTVNKRSLEALAMSGGFDSFTQIKRYQYFAGESISFIEQLIRYGTKLQSDKNNSQQNLFGGAVPISIKRPEILENAEEWSTLYQLEKEKELTGIYLSAHPLDQYRFDVEYFTTNNLSELTDFSQFEGKEISVAGFVTHSQTKTSQKGNMYTACTIEDFTNSFKFNLFGKDFVEYGKFMQVGMCLFIKAIIKRRYKEDNTGDLEFKILNISLLSEARNNVKKVLLQLPFQNVNEEFISELEKLCKKNKGTAQLKFNIFCPNEKISLEMFSRNYPISFNNNILEYLKDNFIDFKLN